MSTDPNPTVPFSGAIPPEVLADAQLVAECVAAGKPIPPEVVQRVRERSDKIWAELLATRGVQDIGVGIIRELRGPLPE
jgi:hypothetical protein